MSTTCQICRGAIPNGKRVDGHTALCAEVVHASKQEAIDEAWGIIANVFDGNWSWASPEWRQTAERWRDRYVTRQAGASR